MRKSSNCIDEVIRNRRTVHNFIPDRMPPRQDLERALQHAVCAPNHYATEPWHFYLLGPSTVEQICILNSEMMRAARGDKAAEIKLRRWREIPGWLLMTCTRSDETVKFMEDYAACSCAAQNLMLSLWDAGIGVKWSTGDVTREPEFYRITGVDPQRESVVGIFWYGYPQEVPDTPRKEITGKLTELA